MEGNTETKNNITLIRTEELKAVIDKLKLGKATSDGITSKMFNYLDKTLSSWMIYNILKAKASIG